MYSFISLSNLRNFTLKTHFPIHSKFKLPVTVMQTGGFNDIVSVGVTQIVVRRYTYRILILKQNET